MVELFYILVNTRTLTEKQSNIRLFGCGLKILNNKIKSTQIVIYSRCTRASKYCQTRLFSKNNKHDQI